MGTGCTLLLKGGAVGRGPLFGISPLVGKAYWTLWLACMAVIHLLLETAPRMVLYARDWKTTLYYEEQGMEN